MDSDSILSCAKPKVLAYLGRMIKEDKVAITEDLSIVRSMPDLENSFDEYYTSQDAIDPTRKDLLRSLMLKKLDAYLARHRIEAKLPEAIVGSNILPRTLIDSVPREVSFPLCDQDKNQGT